MEASKVPLASKVRKIFNKDEVKQIIEGTLDVTQFF
jgi:hypothetical protein